METKSGAYLYRKLCQKNEHYPIAGHIELTYCCGLSCIHCYCRMGQSASAPECQRTSNKPQVKKPKLENQELINQNRELTTKEWKEILDEVQKEGCLHLTFSGGDPLIRDDFLDIYSYAKQKGFIITLFTNGRELKKETISYLAKSPPFSIEITLNGITPETYESITQIPGSFSTVVKVIKLLANSGIRLILKANCLKQNKNELGKIKAWTEELLGKPSQRKYRFKYDTMIYPRLSGDKTPCDHRLSFVELLEAKKRDTDIWKEYQRELKCDFPDLKRDKSYLYRCNSWMQQFFINPYGRLKFCMFSEKFSVDLKNTSFKEGFYQVFPQVLNQRFRTNSKCQDCRLRPVCYHCPARAYLETGDEEAPVEYYCQLAEETAKQMCASG